MMKRALAMMLALCLLLGGLPYAANAEDVAPLAYQEKPEEVVLAFAQALSKADLNGILALSAASRLAPNMDMAAFIERLRTLVPFSENNVPSGDYPAYAPILTLRLDAALAQQVQSLIMSLLVPGLMDEPTPKALVEGKLPLAGGEGITPEELVARLDPVGLDSLRVHTVLRWVGDETTREAYRQNSERVAELHRGVYQEDAELVIVYALGNQLYAGAVWLLRFPEGWLLRALNAPTTGTPAGGAARPLTQDDLQGLVEDARYEILYRSDE